MRSLIRSASRAMSYPTTVPRPLVGSRIPHSMRMVVDLPAPFGPSTPKISPRRTRSETSRTAHRLPKRRESPSVSMTSSSAGIACSGGAVRALAAGDAHEGGDPRVQHLAGIRDAHAHAHHQVGALAL